ncbi:MAG TPA: hypothetical protein VFS20_15865 [Longimicrobium sp.]|nr:hypothetical protein [Longimicrobium sp.]
MKKLVLHIEALEVESFETLSGSKAYGTINARNGDAADPLNPVDPVGPATPERFCTLFCPTEGVCETDLCRTKDYTDCPRSCGYLYCGVLEAGQDVR